MRCAVCGYQSDAEEICPECGREYALGRKQVAARRRFFVHLLVSHIPWLCILVGIPVALLRSGDGIAALWGVIYAALGVGILAIEAVLVMVLLGRPHSSGLGRTIWCGVVGFTGVFAWTVILVMYFA